MFCRTRRGKNLYRDGGKTATTARCARCSMDAWLRLRALMVLARHFLAAVLRYGSRDSTCANVSSITRGAVLWHHMFSYVREQGVSGQSGGKQNGVTRGTATLKIRAEHGGMVVRRHSWRRGINRGARRVLPFSTGTANIAYAGWHGDASKRC